VKNPTKTNKEAVTKRWPLAFLGSISCQSKPYHLELNGNKMATDFLSQPNEIIISAY
jgi:hypothetical protein